MRFIKKRKEKRKSKKFLCIYTKEKDKSQYIKLVIYPTRKIMYEIEFGGNL